MDLALLWLYVFAKTGKVSKFCRRQNKFLSLEFLAFASQFRFLLSASQLLRTPNTFEDTAKCLAKRIKSQQASPFQAATPSRAASQVKVPQSTTSAATATPR